jgi:hypothetical protein
MYKHTYVFYENFKRQKLKKKRDIAKVWGYVQQIYSSSENYAQRWLAKLYNY